MTEEGALDGTALGGLSRKYKIIFLGYTAIMFLVGFIVGWYAAGMLF